jgi:hypothetical protein
MDAAALAGLCALLARGAPPQALPDGVNCPPAAAAPAPVQSGRSTAPGLPPWAAAITATDARDGIARVAYAEAANQGDSGLAAVVYTILNRLADGRWGGAVDSVLNAPHQFEPVMRAGGSWRDLPPVSEAQRARVDTIINLALDGRLPDLTNGARYFQNPRIVATRAANGQVPASLVNFGGAAPSAVIGAHSFYVDAGRGGGRRPSAIPLAAGHRVASDVVLSAAGGAIFVGENRAATAPTDQADPQSDDAPADAPAAASATTEPADPMRAIFVRSDGQTSPYSR